jgi:hypothetical protein
VYRGKGKAEYALTVPENSSFSQLRYKIEHMRAWLTVEDQDRQVPYYTQTGTNLAMKTVKILVVHPKTLTFEVSTVGPATS